MLTTRIKVIESVRSLSKYSRTLFFLQSKTPLSGRYKEMVFSMDWEFCCHATNGSKLILLWSTYLFFNCLVLAQCKRGKFNLGIACRKSRTQQPSLCESVDGFALDVS